ncbi:MAG: branched-chain amino acid ABC transporter permease [Desulfobacterales bacterium]|jgi:branched-subunit amino acid ABC-type transport system permease component|nr:branched-chain amino acid ABC transporter permease [Desulfobacterales bacterium]
MSLPDPSFLLIQSLNGLTYAMFLFLIASGLSLIFGVLRILNFAHGSLYMLGAYFTYQFVSLFIDAPGHFWWAVILASLTVALIGVVIERFFLRHLYTREELYQLLFTYALVLILSDFAKIIWGTGQFSVSRPAILKGAVSILDQYFPKYNIVIILLGPCIAFTFWFIILRTRWGRKIRAAALDREMLGSLGVNVSRLFTVVFFIGAWMAGLGGALVSPVSAIVPGMDVEIIINAFIVVVIGGLGSFWGTFLGSLIVGQVYALGILAFPKLSLAFIYVLMALVLILRPWGLLGRRLQR